MGVEESRVTKAMATKRNKKAEPTSESGQTIIEPKGNIMDYLEKVGATKAKGERIEPNLPDVKRTTQKGVFAKQKNESSGTDFLSSFYKYTDWYNINLAENDIYNTKEAILEKGTLLQKLRLYFHTAELRRFYGTESEGLTKEEIAEIMKLATETKENAEIAKRCSLEYTTIRKFGEDLLSTFKLFQIEFCILAKWLNKLSYCEQKAFECTLLVNAEQTIMEKDELKELLIELVCMHKETGVSFTYDTDAGKMLLKFDDKGGLQQLIKEAVKSCEDALSSFKAFAIAAEEYIKTSTLKYYPIVIQQSIMDAEREVFERGMVEDITFFKSYINDREETGETITPEERERAVIPDYLEIKPDKEVYKNCKHGLKLIEEGKVI